MAPANHTASATALRQQALPVASAPREHPKQVPTPPSSRKRKRPKNDDLSVPTPPLNKRPKTRLTRESTLISNPIYPTSTLYGRRGPGKIPSPTNPTPFLPISKVSSPDSTRVNKHGFGSLPLHRLIEGAFLLVYRPIYPIIRRPKGKPALSTLLPAERLLNTLEALLIGCGWSSRKTPVPKGIELGIVFVDPSDGQTVTNLIQVLCDKQELKNNSINASQSKEILVISKEYLNYFYSYSGGRTIDGQDVKVEFIWSSECKPLAV